MKTTITETQFKQAFRDADRRDNFTNEALGMLFDYLEECEASTGEEMEFNVVAICCEYYEEYARDINDNYSLELDLFDMDDAEAAEAVAEALNDHTSVIGTTSAGTVVFQAY